MIHPSRLSFVTIILLQLSCHLVENTTRAESILGFDDDNDVLFAGGGSRRLFEEDDFPSVRLPTKAKPACKILVDESAFLEDDPVVPEPPLVEYDDDDHHHHNQLELSSLRPQHRRYFQHNDVDHDDDEPHEVDGVNSRNLLHRMDRSPSLQRLPTTTTTTEMKKNRRFLSTGTTIAGLVCCCGKERYVILGADTRATADRMVADKRCEKIHFLANNIWCCGAGTSADLDHVTRQCRYTLALESLSEHESIGNQQCRQTTNSAQRASVPAACRFLKDVLYENGGSVGANLILGGVDGGGAHLRAIHPHGSMDTVPYAALGSGGLAAMGVLESRYRPNLSLEEGRQIIQDAIVAGIKNDLGSGSQVDLCILGPGTTRYIRCAVPEEEIVIPDDENRRNGHDDNDGDAEAATTTTTSSSFIEGVNGFGNVPCLVTSKRLLTRSHEREDKDHHDKWNGLLGL